MTNSVNPNQTAPIGAVCSGSMLFASILNLSAMLGNFLLQATSADDIFRCIFSICYTEAHFIHTIAVFKGALNMPSSEISSLIEMYVYGIYARK